jgi:hypothetical protein
VRLSLVTNKSRAIVTGNNVTFLMSKFKYLIRLLFLNIYFGLPTRRLLIFRKWKICRNKIIKSRNALTDNNMLIITAFMEIDMIIIWQNNFLPHKIVHFLKTFFSQFLFYLWTLKMCVIHVSLGNFFDDSNQKARATCW